MAAVSFGFVLVGSGWRAAAVERSRARPMKACRSSSSMSVRQGRSARSPAALLRGVAAVSALALLLCCTTCESSLLCYCEYPNQDGEIQEHEQDQCFQDGHDQSCETNLTCVLRFHPVDDKYFLFYGCGESYQVDEEHSSTVLQNLCNHTDVPDGSGVLLCCNSSDYCNKKLVDLYPPRPTSTYLQLDTSAALDPSNEAGTRASEAPWLMWALTAVLCLVIVGLVAPALVCLAREISLWRRQAGTRRRESSADALVEASEHT